jgi:hypothetical protein
LEFTLSRVMRNVFAATSFGLAPQNFVDRPFIMLIGPGDGRDSLTVALAFARIPTYPTRQKRYRLPHPAELH